MLIEIANKGIKFESPYTNRAVAQVFRSLVEDGTLNSGFAKDLYAGGKRYGKYTDRQIPWLHVLVAQANGTPTRPQATSEFVMTGLQALHAHLANCRKSRDEGGKGLLYPQVGLLVGDQNVVLKLCGPNSKHKGKVSVAQSHRFGEGEFYGYIDAEGNFKARLAPQAVLDILERVKDCPEQGISDIGKESGHCCYCFAELTTVQSKIAGAGKTCCSNYGVDYPNAEETREFLRECPEILEGASDRERWETPLFA